MISAADTEGIRRDWSGWRTKCTGGRELSASGNTSPQTLHEVPDHPLLLQPTNRPPKNGGGAGDEVDYYP